MVSICACASESETARLQACDGAHVAPARRALRGGEGERHPELGRLRRQRSAAEEQTHVRRHHADDGDAAAVELNGAADDGRIAGEAALPETVAQDRDRVVSLRTFIVGERAPDQRRDAERREEVGRDVHADDFFRRARSGQVDAVVVERRDPLECRRALAPADEVRRREHVGAARPPRVGFPHHDQASGIAERQRLEQHRVDDREDRRVRADAQRERQHRDRREARRAQAQTDGVADVLKDVVHDGIRTESRVIWLSPASAESPTT